MSKLIKITTLSAAAMFCLSAPSHAQYTQYGSGSSYGGGGSSIGSATSSAERSAKRAAKRAAKAEKKRLEAAALKEKAEADLMAKEKLSSQGSGTTYEAPAATQGSGTTYEAPTQGSGTTYQAPTQGSGTTYQAPAAAISGKPTNCPSGTTAQDNGTCMLN